MAAVRCVARHAVRNIGDFSYETLLYPTRHKTEQGHMSTYPDGVWK
jgi:hypothetical protein